MKFFKGFVLHLGSEDNIRRNGIRKIDIEGNVRTPFIGHKGKEGSDPNFSDFANHDATCMYVNDGRVYMKCSCGLEWNFKERSESERFSTSTDTSPGLLDAERYETIDKKLIIPYDPPSKWGTK